MQNIQPETVLEYFDHLGKLVVNIKNRTGAFGELQTLQERTRLAIQSLYWFEQTDTLIELITLFHDFHQILSSDLRQRQSEVRLASFRTFPVKEESTTTGRRRFKVEEQTLINFRSLGFSWVQISQMLLISRWTIYRRVKEYGI